jgi:hypothetical protein
VDCRKFKGAIAAQSDQNHSNQRKGLCPSRTLPEEQHQPQNQKLSEKGKGNPSIHNQHCCSEAANANKQGF